MTRTSCKDCVMCAAFKADDLNSGVYARIYLHM